MPDSNLQHRPFGNTGLSVPPVVFGATVLGNLFVAMNDDEKRELIRQWFAQMPKPIAIDSAGKYGAGLSLEVIGRELKNLGVAPSDVVISNKLAWRRIPLATPEPTFEPGVWINIDHDAIQEISYDGILRCFEDGQSMLGGYPQQLVSVHDPDEYLDAATDADDRNRRLSDIVEGYRALTELRDGGKVAGVGVGAKNWKIIRELDQHCQFDWVMMANSFTIMNHPPELLEFIDSLSLRNVAIINSALTHGGFLVGGKFCDYQPIDVDNPQHARCLQWRDSFTNACEQHSVSPYKVCVAFGASHPAINAVALSTSDPKRVKTMIDAAVSPLDGEIWNTLKTRGLISAEYPHI